MLSYKIDPTEMSTSERPENPEVSVVVTLTSGTTSALEGCLASLSAQIEAPCFEVLVPYDSPVAGVVALRGLHPGVEFLLAEGLDTAGARQGHHREHHDRLRALGLLHARGRIVAFCEDHATASPRWLAELAAALKRAPRAGAVGGAVECGSPWRVNRAVWFCDFVRYALPFGPERVATVSDTNVAYPKEALEAVREVWTEAYREPEVHGALAARGFEIHLVPGPVTRQQRSRLGVGAALAERVAWGRSFGGSRARPWGRGKRCALAPLCLVLPVVLGGRVLRHAFRRGRSREVLTALPMIFLLSIAWALGEAIGTWTGKPEASAT